MSQQVVLHIDNAGDLLATAAYGAGAIARLHRDTTAAFDSPTSVTTVALVSGTDRYELWDADGTSTSWYRFRIENSGGTELSDWSTPFQVMARQDIATLAGVKVALGTGATSTDDDSLQLYINGVNGAIIHRIGYYPGPSSDTSRTFHGKDAVANGRRLWVVPGIRSLTSLSIASSTGETATAVTAADYILGPADHLRRPGEPYMYIEFKDVTTGNWSYFHYGYDNIETEGLYNWGQSPPDLVQRATEWVVHDWKLRQTGGGVAGDEAFGFTDLSRLPAEWRRVIDSYRLSFTV